MCVIVTRTFNQCLGVQYIILTLGTTFEFLTVSPSTPPWRPVVLSESGTAHILPRSPLASSQNPDQPGEQEVGDELDGKPDILLVFVPPLGVTVLL